MNEKTPTPIERITALLAEMTERAIEAERQRAAAREDAEQWYHNYRNKVRELSEAEDKLAAQIEENEELRTALAEYIRNMERGGADNA